MTSNQLAWLEKEETKRANLAREEETRRSNLAKEAETRRANLASEFLKKYSNMIDEQNAATRRAELAETKDWHETQAVLQATGQVYQGFGTLGGLLKGLFI